MQSLFNGFGCRLYHLDCRRVACIYGIESLLLLGRIPAIVVTSVPVKVCLRLAGQASPSPEVQSCEQASFPRRLRYACKYVSVVCVTGCRRSTLSELEVIARETELFKHHRLSVFRRQGKVLVDISVCVFDRCREICLEGVLAYPTPVIRPNVDIHVVDVRT